MKTDKKRGRLMITGKLREPNGRISRAKKPHKPPPQATVAMRAKHCGLSIEEAKNLLSSSYIGRLCLLGYKQAASGISKDQYDTAQRYLQVRNDYLCAKGLPHGYYDNFRHTTSDEKAQTQWVQRATDSYKDMKRAIQDAQNLHRQHNFEAALQYLVVEDKPLPSFVCSLRLILNALHQYFEY
ncbi:hypothetical protein [Bartonella rattaustraliani]|uniref:hypothetical protein n=1 Tax=Bartonella rattaustraliani TaxID=481139 RepID=UPI00031F6B9C|nr:hypothetical protein [Bartonella rattaustraliani]